MDSRADAGTTTALLAGATGLVGRALLVRLLAGERRQRVVVLARKPLPATVARDPRLTVLVGDMAALADDAGAIDDALRGHLLTELQNLDRQGKTTEPRHQLGPIGDDDHASR